MNIQINDNKCVMVKSNLVILNGKEYPIPSYVKNVGNNQTIINQKVFINGYELKETGEWKITLRAMFYYFFT